MSTFEDLVEKHNEGKYGSSLLVVKKFQIKMMRDLGFSVPENEQWMLKTQNFDKFESKVLGGSDEVHEPNEIMSEFETRLSLDDSDLESKQRLRVSNIYEKEDRKIAVIFLPADISGNTVSSTINIFSNFVGVNIADDDEEEAPKKESSSKKKKRKDAESDRNDFLADEVSEYMLVTKNPIKGASAKPLQKLMEHPSLKITLFQDIDFRYNPLEGCFVGAVHPFSGSEKSSFLKNNDIKDHRFPSIFTNDPVAKRHLLSPGDLISFELKLPDSLICTEKIEIRAAVTSKLQKIVSM